MSVRTEQIITAIFIAADASATASATLYLNGVADDASVVVLNRGGRVFSAEVELPTLVPDDVVAIVASSTFSAVTTTEKIWEAVCDAPAAEENAAAVVGALAGQAISTRTYVQREHIELYRGDEYKSSEGTGRRLTFTKAETETHWPTTLDTVHFYCSPSASAITNGRASAAEKLADVSCTITQATGSQALYVELTQAQTATLSDDAQPGDYEFQLIANKADYPALLREGTMNVRDTLRTLV